MFRQFLVGISLIGLLLLVHLESAILTLYQVRFEMNPKQAPARVPPGATN